jgi:hypothetical protein
LEERRWQRLRSEGRDMQIGQIGEIDWPENVSKGSDQGWQPFGYPRLRGFLDKRPGDVRAQPRSGAAASASRLIGRKSAADSEQRRTISQTGLLVGLFRESQRRARLFADRATAMGVAH